MVLARSGSPVSCKLVNIHMYTCLYVLQIRPTIHNQTEKGGRRVAPHIEEVGDTVGGVGAEKS